MTDHYVGMYRGVDGFRIDDFVTGTSSTATTVFELRILDTSGLVRAIDVKKAIEAFERFFENADQVNNAGFDVVT